MDKALKFESYLLGTGGYRPNNIGSVFGLLLRLF